MPRDSVLECASPLSSLPPKWKSLVRVDLLLKGSDQFCGCHRYVGSREGERGFGSFEDLIPSYQISRWRARSPSAKVCAPGCLSERRHQLPVRLARIKL